jgi:serine protease Do
MAQSQGSGFIISPDGYVVTNNHVVENASGDVSLTLDDGRSVTASVVGSDPKTDLALLKIKDAGPFKAVSFSSAAPRVGDWVIAVGNPFGLGGTVTAGIVSARGRDIGAGPYDDFLQIDAPVNRGNSGGPAFNANGDVVGVNTAIYSPSGGSVGIGFAIPAEVARDVIAALKDKGAVARGWMGVQIQPVTDEIADSMGLRSNKGALVAETQPNSPALAAGLRSGDVIVAVNGDRIESPRELSRRIAAMGPEARVELTYLHAGAEKTTSVRLAAPPNDAPARLEPARLAEPDAPLKPLGLTLAPARNGEAGVAVAQVEPEGAAARQGLRPGDVILEAAGQPVARPADVQGAFAAARKEGRKAVLLRVRSGEAVRFVALAANPAT